MTAARPDLEFGDYYVKANRNDGRITYRQLYKYKYVSLKLDNKFGTILSHFNCT